jgi:integrase
VRDVLTGKRTHFSTRERSKRLAQQVAIERLEALAREVERGIEERGFAEAYEEWLGLKTVRPVSMKRYRQRAGVLVEAFGDRRVDEVRARDVEGLLKRLAYKGLKPISRSYYLKDLKSFFRHAVRNRYCEASPVADLRVKRGKTTPGRALTFDEARIFVRACREPGTRVMKYATRRWAEQSYQTPDYLLLVALIALYTGLRRKNVFDLRWRDIDLGARKIELPGERMKNHEDLVIPIHWRLAEVLREEVRRRGKCEPDEPVIGVDLQRCRRSFDAAVRRAEIGHLRLHDCRHTFSTWMDRLCSYAARQQLLGHSKGGQITLSYTHVPFEELREAVDRLPDLLEEPKEQAKTAEA